MIRYVCSECQCVYRPELGDQEHEIAPSTPWEEVPESWECPRCGAHKDAFLAVHSEPLTAGDIDFMDDEHRAMMCVYELSEEHIRLAPLTTRTDFFGKAYLFDADHDLLEVLTIDHAGEIVAHSLDTSDIASVVMILDAGDSLDGIELPEGEIESFLDEDDHV